jgi:hypothetical protein
LGLLNIQTLRDLHPQQVEGAEVASKLHELQSQDSRRTRRKGAAMLDPWIIEEILRREEDFRRERDGARVELPLDAPRSTERPAIPPRSEEGERGVVVIDI